MPLGEIIGQEKPLRILRGVLRTGRMPTSYLFSGEKGIGKCTTARAFAQAINCEAPQEGDACGRCAACRKTSAGIHPDLRIIEPDGGVIKVEQVRELEEFLSFRPYEGLKKVVIVDDADAMNPFAANAFLKTLEEPPAESVIILVASRPEFLPETIRSRCFRIRFLPLSEREMDRAAERLGLPGGDAPHRRLAMGRAGLLANDEVVARRNHAFSAFQEMMAGRDVAVPKERNDIEELIDYFILFLRDGAVAQSTEQGTGLMNQDLSEKLASLCKDMDINGIINIYNELVSLKGTMFYNLNKSVVMNYLSSLLAHREAAAGP